MISREDVAKVLEQRARDCESGTFALPPDVARYMAGGILALLQPEVAALEERARKLESEEHISPGTGMYLALARSVIDRILSAEANCDPPLDILLRLEAIIRERDALKAEIATDNALLAERQRILDALPCPTHGPCVPHVLAALEAVGRLVRAVDTYTDYPSENAMTGLVLALYDPALAAWRK